MADYTPGDRCPRCGSRAPHLHPAVQHEGEVSICPDPFHRIVTSQNTVERMKSWGIEPQVASAE